MGNAKFVMKEETKKNDQSMSKSSKKVSLKGESRSGLGSNAKFVMKEETKKEDKSMSKSSKKVSTDDHGFKLQTKADGKGKEDDKEKKTGDGGSMVKVCNRCELSSSSNFFFIPCN